MALLLQILALYIAFLEYEDAQHLEAPIVVR
jgi:hypothetical protein